MKDSQRGSQHRVGCDNLLFNQHKWNNCFIKKKKEKKRKIAKSWQFSDTNFSFPPAMHSYHVCGAHGKLAHAHVPWLLVQSKLCVNEEHCICIVFDLFVVRSWLELFCFLSFVSFVLRHVYSLTHRIYQTLELCHSMTQFIMKGIIIYLDK